MIGYLAGSIPFGLLIGKAKRVDVRRAGSGNIGATNVGRVLGRRWGLLCLGLDATKGLVPTAWAGLVMGAWGNASIDARAATWWVCVAGAAVAGHMFPVWLRFKGGKGVATGLGVCLGVHPFLSVSAACALVVWVTLVKMTRYVGVSSCVAAVSLCVFVWVWHGMGLWSRLTGGARVSREGLWPFLIGTGVIAVVVVVKHRGNLARTLRGEEHRVGGR